MTLPAAMLEPSDTPWWAERFDEFRGLLGTTEAPDRLLVACYAWLEVHELAQAAYLLAQNRKLPQPDFSNFSQTVVKMVDFSYTTIVSHSRRRGLCRAAAPTVQGGSARDSHPGTPI